MVLSLQVSVHARNDRRNGLLVQVLLQVEPLVLWGLVNNFCEFLEVFSDLSPLEPDNITQKLLLSELAFDEALSVNLNEGPDRVGKLR